MAPKFTAFDAQRLESAHDYGRVFQLEATEHYARLKIGASQSAIDLMLELALGLQPPYFVLYVLLISRGSWQPTGRYQSPPLQSSQDVAAFLNSFRWVLEADGRHHVWIGNARNEGLIIYDKHNVIYAYGPLAYYRAVLEKRGFKEQAFAFPYPHGHSYGTENDAEISRLLAHWEWQHFPLIISEDTPEEDEA